MGVLGMVRPKATDIEGVVGVQGERDAGFHLLNVGDGLSGLSSNRHLPPLEILEILGRLLLRQLGCIVAEEGKIRLVRNNAMTQDALLAIKTDQGRIDLVPAKQVDRVQRNLAVRKFFGTDL
jgi:hypothetical protein